MGETVLREPGSRAKWSTCVLQKKKNVMLLYDLKHERWSIVDAHLCNPGTQRIESRVLVLQFIFGTAGLRGPFANPFFRVH